MMSLVSSKWFARFFVMLIVVDNAFTVVADTYNWDVNMAFNFFFASLYLVEVVCKVTAWGMFGGTASYWNENIFNRVDIIVTIASWIEVGLYYIGREVSLRPFKMMRLLKVLYVFEFFHGLEDVVHTMEVGSIALGTVLYLILFFYVLFGVMGMELLENSYSRRCYWADTGEQVKPEKYCKRFDQKYLLQKGAATGKMPGPGMLLNNNCGSLQVCRDGQSLSYGFVNFDNMASAFITIFQAFTTDAQSQIMWAAIQAEPQMAFFVVLYFLGIAFVIDQTLMNVFLAVLTTVFTCE